MICSYAINDTEFAISRHDLTSFLDENNHLPIADIPKLLTSEITICDADGAAVLSAASDMPSWSPIRTLDDLFASHSQRYIRFCASIQGTPHVFVGDDTSPYIPLESFLKSASSPELEMALSATCIQAAASELVLDQLRVPRNENPLCFLEDGILKLHFGGNTYPLRASLKHASRKGKENMIQNIAKQAIQNAESIRNNYSEVTT